MNRVPAPRVRFIAGVDLLGKDELAAVCFAAVVLVGALIGGIGGMLMRALL